MAKEQEQSGSTGARGAAENAAVPCASVEAVPDACDEELQGASCSQEALRFIHAKASVSVRKKRRPIARERLALVIFACLLVAGFVALTSYISAGHSLNVTATNIDDIAGNMENYDVVLFDGTVEQPHTEEEDAEGLAALTKNPHLAADPYTLEDARDLYEGKKASVIELNVEEPRQYVNGRVIMKSGHVYGILSVPEDLVEQLVIPKVTTTKTTVVTTEGEEYAPEQGIGPENATTVTHVKNAYDSVSELLAATEEASVANPKLVERVERILKRFENAGVDTVIAITPDPRPFASIEGIDVVLTVKQQDRFARAETIDGTLYVDTPERGSVGALLIAPGNVVSSKILNNS